MIIGLAIVNRLKQDFSWLKCNEYKHALYTPIRREPEKSPRTEELEAPSNKRCFLNTLDIENKMMSNAKSYNSRNDVPTSHRPLLFRPAHREIRDKRYVNQWMIRIGGIKTKSSRV